MVSLVLVLRSPKASYSQNQLHVEGHHGMLFTSNYLLFAGECSSKCLSVSQVGLFRVCIWRYSAHQAVLTLYGSFS